jgi:hypothetical protein
MAPNAAGASLLVRALLGVLCMYAVAACDGQGTGGDGSADLPSATRSVTRSVDLPSATRSRPEPTPEPPTRTSEAPAPTDGEPTRTREPDDGGPTAEEPDETRPGPTDTTTVTASAPSPSATQAGAETSTGEDDDTGWWWLAGLLALAAVLTGVILIRRHRRHAAWSAGLADALGEASWLSHDLVATLQSQNGEGRAGVWEIGRPRVLRLEHALEPLAEQAPDPVMARHCTALASAVQVLRTMLDQADATGDLGGEATTTALRQAQHELDEAIAVLQET